MMLIDYASVWNLVNVAKLRYSESSRVQLIQ